MVWVNLGNADVVTSQGTLLISGKNADLSFKETEADIKMEEGPETADALATWASPCPADHPTRPAASMLTDHRKWRRRGGGGGGNRFTLQPSLVCHSLQKYCNVKSGLSVILNLYCKMYQYYGNKRCI